MKSIICLKRDLECHEDLPGRLFHKDGGAAMSKMGVCVWTNSLLGYIVYNF